MTRAKLKELMCSDLDLRTYVPENPSVFGFCLEMKIGSDSSSGADLFQVLVCTAKWLEAEVKESGARWHRSIVMVDAYDFHQLVALVEKTINSIEGRDWSEVVAKLRLLADWEFEGYGRD